MSRKNRQNAIMRARTGAAILALTCIVFSGCMSIGGATVEDDQGRFYFSKADALEEIPSGDGHYHYYLPEVGVHAFVTAEAGYSSDRALHESFLKIGLEAEHFVETGTSSMGDWTLKTFAHSLSDEQIAVAYQYRGDTAYSVIVTTDSDKVDPGSPPSAVMRIVGSMQFTEAAGVIFAPADIAELERYVGRAAIESGASVSIAALRDGEVIYSHATGNRTRGALTDVGVAYNWGSITKLVTTTALMQQVELGAVHLDTPVTEYLPEIMFARTVTVRNLLTHSSGLPSFEVLHIIGYPGAPVPDLESVLADYVGRADELVFEPGSVSQYNNWNFLLLGVIVERISGESLTEYAQRHIFEPIGMTETAHLYKDLQISEASPIMSIDAASGLRNYMESQSVDPARLIIDVDDYYVYLDHIDILPAWGGVRSTGHDAVLFGWMFANDGKADGVEILKKKTIKTALKMQKSNDGQPLGMGLGWFLGRDSTGTYAEHAGGGPGINSLLRLYPKKDLVVAVLTNTNDVNISQLLGYIVDLL